MQGLVSSRRPSVAAPVALFATWLACCMVTVPSGLRWIDLEWMTLAVAAALLASFRPEPLLAVAAKPRRFAARVAAHLAWLSLVPVLLSASTPDRPANLIACKSGWPSCERAGLTEA